MTAIDNARAAATEYYRLREKQGVVYGDEAAALADRQNAALRTLIAEHERPRPVTEAMLNAAIAAVNDVGAVLYRETMRAAIEAALRVPLHTDGGGK